MRYSMPQSVSRLFAVTLRFLWCLALLLACSKPPGVCAPATCNGCCDEMGACVEGTTQAACGLYGVACHICSPEGACQNGACTAECTASNCNGCCDGLGICRLGDDS